MKRLLFALSAALLLGSCEPTTYGKAIQAQKAAPAPEPVANPTPTCPTVAEEGTVDYERCQRLLEKQEGVGGSGQDDPARLSEPSAP